MSFARTSSSFAFPVDVGASPFADAFHRRVTVPADFLTKAGRAPMTQSETVNRRNRGSLLGDFS